MSIHTAQPDAAPPADRRPRVLVIVPAYNEEGSVGQVVAELGQRLPEYDVVVVDDGSGDATAARVPEGAAVVRLPFNLGIGGAMQAGYRYAQRHGYDVAVQVDADGQHPPEHVQMLVEHLQQSGADLVIGSRFVEPSAYRAQLSRLLGIRWLNLLLSLTAGQRVTDGTSGFRAASRRVIEAFARWYPDDYPEPEVLVLLHKSGLTLREVPVSMLPRTTGRTSIPFFYGVFYVVKVSLAIGLATVRRPWGRLA